MNESLLLRLLRSIFNLFVTEDNFEEEISALESEVSGTVNSILGSLNTTSGKIDREDEENLERVTESARRIQEAFNNSDFSTGVEKYVRKFDEIEDLNRQVHEGVNQVNIAGFNISEEKNQAIDQVIEGMLSGTRLTRDLGTPLRRILFRHVTRGSDITAAKAELDNFILGNPEQRSVIRRHIGQLSTDALQRFDGLINQKFVEEFGMNGWRIVGSLIETSRENCYEAVNGLGLIGRFQVDDVFRVDEIPEIIEIAETRSGWIAGTDTTNFFINRFGYNCRHQFIPTFILEETGDKRKDSFAENVTGEDGETLQKI